MSYSKSLTPNNTNAITNNSPTTSTKSKTTMLIQKTKQAATKKLEKVNKPTPNIIPNTAKLHNHYHTHSDQEYHQPIYYVLILSHLLLLANLATPLHFIPRL